MTTTNLHYSANGGVITSDIAAVGGFGYMSVSEVNENILDGFNNSSGTTSNGNNLAILISGANSNTNHMVVVTGVRMQNGHQVIDYYDPTLDIHSVTTANYVKAGYEIGSVGSNPYPWASSGF